MSAAAATTRSVRLITGAVLRLEEEKVTASGRFHSFHDVTSLPRPTQKPGPPFWIAALSIKESFQNAGTLGHWLMAIPLVGAQMASLLGAYREARRAAGHPGCDRIMLAFHMFCAPTVERAVAVARAPLNQYLQSIVAAASGWMSGASSRYYPNYDKMIAGSTLRPSSRRWRSVPPGSAHRIGCAPPWPRMIARSAGSRSRRYK